MPTQPRASQSAPSSGPRDTDRLIGHEAAEAALLDALRGGRLHHAWLITGAEGVGKATLAYRFARRLLGGGTATLDMARSDPVFRRVAANTHADLLTIEREWDDKKKRLKKQVSAESVREIPPFLHLTPAEGGWRVVILDGAEDVNPQSANALLKVLEEPPPRAVLMLVCSAPGRLLPTICSRCRHLALAPLDDAAMALALRTSLPEMEEADRATLATLARGSPGRALALAEGGLQLAALANEALQAGPDMSLLRAYEMADALREQAEFETFMGLLQNGIAAAVTASVRGTADAGQRRLIAAGSTLFWAETAEAIARLAQETERSNMDRRQATVMGLALLRRA